MILLHALAKGGQQGLALRAGLRDKLFQLPRLAGRQLKPLAVE